MHEHGAHEHHDQAHEGHDHAAAGGIEWEDDMVEINRLTTPANMRWKLIDKATGAENAAIDWRFRVGDQVKLRLLNEMAGDHPMHHPFHVHGAGRFLVLSRDGIVEPNLVWKDTVLIRTGETVDILLDVTNPGLWMAHCHIAEHHESGMMFSFNVDPFRPMRIEQGTTMTAAAQGPSGRSARKDRTTVGRSHGRTCGETPGGARTSWSARSPRPRRSRRCAPPPARSTVTWSATRCATPKATKGGVDEDGFTFSTPTSPRSTSSVPTKSSAAGRTQRCHFLARSLEPVRCDQGLTVIPTDTPATLPDPELIVVARKREAGAG